MELQNIFDEKEIDTLILSYVEACNSINKDGAPKEEIVDFIDWAQSVRIKSFILDGILERKLFAVYDQEEGDYRLYTKEQIQEENTK